MIIIYRSRLEWCNFTCEYCYWHNKGDSIKLNKQEAADDKIMLHKIIDRLQEKSDFEFEFFFTPAAEVIALPYYRQAMQKLIQLENCRVVTAQTNLSWNVKSFLEKIDQNLKHKIRFWATFHPTEMDESKQEKWIEKVRHLKNEGIKFSVGAVGIKKNIPSIQKMKLVLDDLGIFFWVNAYKRYEGYYNVEEIEALESVDPFFKRNNQFILHKNKPCSAGKSSFYLTDTGDIRRCNWVDDIIGNIYDDNFQPFTENNLCEAARCQCYVGHMMIPSEKYEEVYGDFRCSRIPMAFQ